MVGAKSQMLVEAGIDPQCPKSLLKVGGLSQPVQFFDKDERDCVGYRQMSQRRPLTL
jgi:hypothetical protein